MEELKRSVLVDRTSRRDASLTDAATCGLCSRCIREVEPFDSEFMIVSGDPAYLGLCSSLAGQIQDMTLQAHADNAADGERNTVWHAEGCSMLDFCLWAHLVHACDRDEPRGASVHRICQWEQDRGGLPLHLHGQAR
jgi:hypothetical protein